ncbi:MAG: patatin, partial [Acidobacteria bacterium]
WLFADAASVGPRGRIGDDRLGHAAPPPSLRIVDAVAASCAYPPFLAPMELDGRVLGLVGGTADPDEPDEVREAILRRIQLVDGGVYDNLGVERVWSDHATVLVSDGGAVFRGRAVATVVSRLWHVLSVAGSGGQTTRLRWLRAALSAGDLQGAAWSLGSPAGGHPGRVAEINRIRTDLDAFTAGEQMVLERHGYLVADASVRRHSPQVVALEAPTAPPHPEAAVAAWSLGSPAGSARVTARGRRRRRRG